jgi:hypothetical protein
MVTIHTMIQTIISFQAQTMAQKDLFASRVAWFKNSLLSRSPMITPHIGNLLTGGLAAEISPTPR